MDLFPGNERGPRGGRALAHDTITPRSIADFADTRAATREWLKKDGPALLLEIDRMSRVACDGSLSLLIGETAASLKSGQGVTALVKLSQALALASSAAAKLGRWLSEGVK